MSAKRKKAKLGRPPKPAGQARSVQIIFRAEPGLHKSIAKAAKEAGKPLASWIHDTLETLLRRRH
jgi:predicted HicB family RNase H-like nuclease